MQDTDQNKTENRINEIETKLAFLEHSVQQINDVVVSQQNKIDALNRGAQLMIARVKDLMATAATYDAEPSFADPASEKPPHY